MSVSELMQNFRRETRVIKPQMWLLFDYISNVVMINFLNTMSCLKLLFVGSTYEIADLVKLKFHATWKPDR